MPKLFIVLFWTASVVLGVAFLYVGTMYHSPLVGKFGGPILTGLLAWWAPGTKAMFSAYDNREELPWFLPRLQRLPLAITLYLIAVGFPSVLYGSLSMATPSIVDAYRDAEPLTKWTVGLAYMACLCASGLATMWTLAICPFRGLLTILAVGTVVAIGWGRIYPSYPPHMLAERTVTALAFILYFGVVPLRAIWLYFHLKPEKYPSHRLRNGAA